MKKKHLEALRDLARFLDPEPDHAFQVCKLALMLFDQTQTLHGLKSGDRDILEAAALLHDVGYQRGADDHHKHSRDIILQTDLPGFSIGQRDIAACVARYHRKGLPRPDHKVYRDLSPADQDLTGRLAALLRVADGLDRSHTAAVQSLEASVKDSVLYIKIRPGCDCGIDLRAATKKSNLLQQVFGVPVAITLAGPIS